MVIGYNAASAMPSSCATLNDGPLLPLADTYLYCAAARQTGLHFNVIRSLNCEEITAVGVFVFANAASLRKRSALISAQHLAPPSYTFLLRSKDTKLNETDI